MRGGFSLPNSVHKKRTHCPSKIEWDRIPTDPSESCDRVIRYPGFFGVRSVGPVGDLLDIGKYARHRNWRNKLVTLNPVSITTA